MFTKVKRGLLLCILAFQLTHGLEKKVFTTNSLPGFKKNDPSVFPPGFGGRNASQRIILDIGANNGDDYTLRGYKAGHTVVAFEPSPAVSLLFQRTMLNNRIDTSLLHPRNKRRAIESAVSRIALSHDDSNRNEVFLFPVALSNKTGNSYFHQSPCNNLEKCGKVNHLVSTTKDAQAIEVEIYKLDEVSLPVNEEDIWFMKIDVEGHENEVLQGAKNLIKKAKIPYIGIEFAAQRRKGKAWGIDLLNTLHQYGYTCHHLRGFGKCHDESLHSPSLKCNYPFSLTNATTAPTFDQYTSVFEIKTDKDMKKPPMSDMMCARRNNE